MNAVSKSCSSTARHVGNKAPTIHENNMHRKRRVLLQLASLLAMCLVIPQVAHADLITFDFENLAPNFVSPPQTSRPGALTTLSISAGGVTMSITRPGSAFDLASNTGSQGGKPFFFGNISLDPFFDTSNTPFVVNFSTGIIS